MSRSSKTVGTAPIRTHRDQREGRYGADCEHCEQDHQYAIARVGRGPPEAASSSQAAINTTSPCQRKCKWTWDVAGQRVLQNPS